MEEEIAGASKQNGKVMIAIDGSESSSYALKWAVEHLDHKLKSGVIIFTATSADYTGVFSGSYGSVPLDLVTSLQGDQKDFTVSLLTKAKELCEKHGIDAETVALMGNPKEAICDAVQKFNCQLLIMGSRSRGRIRRTFLGSVSDYCVHHAKCPVLVVKQSV
ncbi:universal stress protein PHOS32-like [Chenopodium quinoa]|uniref:UspA domain-containing protein n=1 Tax=Chenopodium quinoa TaxID=63459 RepID=A0A803MYP3_CHEQI|nr:universal stress protein PHOS32-like [Chenopodium quinoa]